MLPILVFGAGFNMKRRRFFDNIGPILVFGIIGSVISFVSIGLFTYTWSELGLITRHGKTTYITIEEALLVGATLAATDVVCTIALIKEEKTPRLQRILFGESITNDVIAIVLLATFEQVKISEIDAYSMLRLLVGFTYILLSSTLLGIIFGAFSAYFTKHFRKLKDWPN